jgi:FAD/FMN-containing dehydrogenase
VIIPGIRGRSIVAGDADYDAARAIFYGGTDKHPGLIVRVADSADVARVITFARENGIELAVRSGGHSPVGLCSTEGGIVLDLHDMRALDIDASRRTAWAQPGLTAGEYTNAAADLGLANSFGDTGSVGLGGLVTGGGVGYMVRKHGLTIDALLSAEVVTADGKIVKTDESTEPDLFWAIRGGGGNFGVVTRLQLRMHEAPSVVGGILILPATPEIIESFMALADAAPEELTTIANVMPAPPMPFLPEQHHGKVVIFAMLVYVGPVDEGTRALAPFRDIATPLADLMHPMSYREVYPPEDPSYHPIGAGRNFFVDTVDHASAETIVDVLTERAPQFGVAQLRVLGGAMARVPSDATAFAHRTRRIMINTAGLFERPEETDLHERWVEHFASLLQRGERGRYVNFLSKEGPAGIRDAYPSPTWERLLAIKRRYDPTNLFRLNQNVWE